MYAEYSSLSKAEVKVEKKTTNLCIIRMHMLYTIMPYGVNMEH